MYVSPQHALSLSLPLLHTTVTVSARPSNKNQHQQMNTSINQTTIRINEQAKTKAGIN